MCWSKCGSCISEADDSRLGALIGVYRHIGNNLKIGVG